ncbi:MAG: class I SAM-dependent methyltransferase [Verrucomicrobia bacterium]|nr:class I SAM-dependent methyltransferase [Verrucomicrobiota bacterium]
MDDWYRHFDDDLWLKTDDMPVEQARFIRRALGLRKGQRLLDVPCGAGRTSLAMAKLGIEVTGVDLRSKFTNRAKRRFRKEGLLGTFLVGDMRELDFREEFHAVVNWFTSFGYFSEAENLDVLGRFSRALRPGGKLLVDTANRERVLRHFVAKVTTPLPAAPGRPAGTVTQRCRWNRRYERVEAVWTLRRGRRQAVCPMHVRFYTPAQYRRLFERVGLEFDAIHGSWTGDAYSRSSPRMIVVARKPR